MFNNQQLPLTFIDSHLNAQQYDVDKEVWMQAPSEVARHLHCKLNSQLQQLAPDVDWECCECGDENCDDGSRRSGFAVFADCIGAAVMQL